MRGLPPRSSRRQSMLQAAVQSVQWTYSIFWQLCPLQRTLVWGDGYYNGTIKTRKTVESVEVTAEEAMTQRSQELRELYETLMAGETNQPPEKRSFVALSPEDLTEGEWFYLMCISFSFPPGSWLPGKAYGTKRHVWLTEANKVDSKTFTRAILAKSAKIQTVVCIPLLGGVVELGTTDKVHENLSFICHIKSFFTDDHQTLSHSLPSKPTLSEHSTSNPSSLLSSSPPPNITHTKLLANDVDQDEEDDMDAADDVEEEDEEEEDTAQLDDGGAAVVATTGVGSAADPIELMQLDFSEDIRLGSPDEVSNNLDSRLHMLAASGHSGNAGVGGLTDDCFRVESSRPWPCSPDQLNGGSLQPRSLELPITSEDEDGNYAQTVSMILGAQPTSWADLSSTLGRLIYSSNQSSFAKWPNQDTYLDSHAQRVHEGASQWVLKYILSTVPFLHAKLREETSSPKSRARDAAEAKIRRTTPAAQDELSANHVVAERRRREKLNERFITLRSLVPFVTKMDKVSILGDTIEYVKQLRKKIQDMEIEKQQQRQTRPNQKTRGGSKAAKMSSVAMETEDVTGEAATAVEVSIIESDALLEIRCENRKGLLLDILKELRELLIESTSVHATVNGEIFAAEIRAEVEDNPRGKRASIMEVKKAINQIIPFPY